MRRQRRASVVRRRRQFVTLGRLAAWLGFGGAVLSQAALLAGGYLLVDDAPHALRNAGIAGGVALAGIVVMVLARRAGKRAQSSVIKRGRVPLRLVLDAEPGDDRQRRRPAA